MQSQILIKGTVYTLRLPIREMIACEAAIAPHTLAKIFSPTIEAGATDVGKINLELPGIEVLAKILYSAMRSEYKGVTMEQVCSLLDDYLEEAVEGTSALYVLYVILGQACGFFKGFAENPQKVMNRKIQTLKNSAKVSSKSEIEG